MPFTDNGISQAAVKALASPLVHYIETNGFYNLKQTPPHPATHHHTRTNPAPALLYVCIRL